MIDYFDDRGIKYTVGPAKNVAKGRIGIKCPFAGCQDRSNHCGIELSTLRFHCFVCGESGDAVKLIREIEECSFKEAKGIIRRFNLGAVTRPTPTGGSSPLSAGEVDSTQIKTLSYPKDVVTLKGMPKSHRRYLSKRGFDPSYIWKKYKLAATSHLGHRFKYRILIPYFYKRKMVTFTSRDITDKSELKYQHLSDEESSIPIKSLLYGEEFCGDKVIIVEGPMDVWRIGDGACALMTTSMTNDQMLRLIDMGVMMVYILLDSDAVLQARRLKFQLRGIIPYVEVISMDRGDPADSLTRTNIKFLRGLLK